MRIFLIRHGESIQNIGKSNNLPDPDIYLSDKGKEQARETSLKLKEYIKENNISLDNARMWVSPYLRTEETANIINQELMIKSVFQDPRLVEKDFGNYDGKDREEWESIDPVTIKTIRKRYDSVRSRFFTRMPNGESAFDVYNRMSGFIDTIFRDDKDPLFIVAHGDTIRCLIMRWFHKDIAWYYNEPTCNNASVTLIDKKDNKYFYEMII